jgi:Cu-Zn family superoxide dismutase
MRHTILIAATCALLIPVAGLAQPRKPDVPGVRVELKNADGKAVGEATLEQTPHGVLLRATFTGLPAGTHALHVHAVGTCEPPGFESAGGHFNPAGRKHGYRNPDGPHPGDLPNLHVPDGGRLTIEVLAREVSLGGAPEGAGARQERTKGDLLAGDGTALVVHARADDHASDPAGQAGDRIACGVIRR